MSVDNQVVFQAISARAKKELVPKLRVGPKSQFMIHTIINALLNVVYPKAKKDIYLKSYNTTLGFTVALAEHQGSDVLKFGNWRTLCHEVKHALQAKKWTRLLFGYLYLWPISQGIALLFLGWVPVFWIPGLWKLAYLAGWLVATAVHFIPNLPDPWRTRWEYQGYSISMHLRYLVYGSIDDDYIEHLVENFNSMMYYIMEPNREKITKKLKVLAALIQNGESPVGDEPIVQIAEEEFRKAA